MPQAVHGQNVGITLLLLALLGAIFLAGFSEAIGIAVAPIATYLTLNLVVMVVSAGQLLSHPDVVWEWSRLLISEYPTRCS